MIPKEMIEAFSNAWDRYNERPGRLTHEERIEFALAAALSSQWRGMESAPRDGTAVLLLSARQTVSFPEETIHHPPKCHIGKWNPEGASWTDELGGFQGEICTLSVTGNWESGGGWFQPNEVTHWMPLPPPPEEKAE